jgi:hypothetical protein
MRPRIEGMARNAILHPDGADLSHEILVDITDDVLTYVGRQGVVRPIVKGILAIAILLFPY